MLHMNFVGKQLFSPSCSILSSYQTMFQQRAVMLFVISNKFFDGIILANLRVKSPDPCPQDRKYLTTVYGVIGSKSDAQPSCTES